MSEVQKPISVILNEKKDELIEIINRDLKELHPSLLEPIVKDIYLAVADQKKKIEQMELEKYNSELAKDFETEIVDKVDSEVVEEN